MVALQAAFTVSGVGLHSGRPARARVSPGLAGAGARFGPSPTQLVPARVAYARTEGGCTTLAGEGFAVATVEHLLAACWALGVADVDVLVEGGELPGLDGSAAPWARALRDAGLASGPAAPGFRVLRPLVVRAAGGLARVAPHPSLVVRASIDFGPGGPTGQAAWAGDPARFLAEIAPARTFVLASMADALRASGRGAGATAENTVLWPPIAPLRFADEPARHKLLDLLGDLALLGGPLVGEVVVDRGSHALHVALVREALASGAIGAVGA